VIVVVDVGQVAQFRRGQRVLDDEEPQPSRLRAQPVEDVGQQGGVRALDLPDAHLRAVAQQRQPAADRRRRPRDGSAAEQPGLPGLPGGGRVGHECGAPFGGNCGADVVADHEDSNVERSVREPKSPSVAPRGHPCGTRN
jgi:hypothetical protein